MKKVLMLLAIAATFMMAPAAQAQDYRHGGEQYIQYRRPTAESIMWRIDNQQYRVNQAYSSGFLSRRQARDMQRHIDRIWASYRSMRSDGYLSDRDVARLDRMLDNNRDRLRRALRNSQWEQEWEYGRRHD